MSRATQFIQLQNEVNRQIDNDGQASEHSVNQLSALGDSLSPQEIDEVCRLAKKQEEYENAYRW